MKGRDVVNAVVRWVKAHPDIVVGAGLVFLGFVFGVWVGK